MNLENLNLAELNALELQETNGGIFPIFPIGVFHTGIFPAGIVTAAGTISGMFSSWAAAHTGGIKSGGH